MESTGSHWHELSPQRCLELLGSCAIGRVAAVADRFPFVFPVNYRLVLDAEPWILLRSSPGGSIDRTESHVAFEIDGFSSNDRSGWCVLVRGGVRPLTEEEMHVARAIDPDPWFDEGRDLWLGIWPLSITGRQLHNDVAEWHYHASAYL